VLVVGWECSSSVVLSHETCSFVMAPLAVRSHGDGLSEPIVVFCCWAQMAVITASTARAVIQISYIQLFQYCDTRISRETIQRNLSLGLNVRGGLLAWKEPVPYMNEIIRLVFIVGHEPRLFCK
jgi:predicted metal-binding membrane protein